MGQHRNIYDTLNSPAAPTRSRAKDIAQYFEEIKEVSNANLRSSLVILLMV